MSRREKNINVFDASLALVTSERFSIEATDDALDERDLCVFDFLHERVFDPILQSPVASEKLKQGARGTIMWMEQRDAAGMVQYYWSAIIGTERSIGFAALLRQEGFERFEEALEEFRIRFDDDFLRQ